MSLVVVLRASFDRACMHVILSPWCSGQRSGLRCSENAVLLQGLVSFKGTLQEPVPALVVAQLRATSPTKHVCRTVEAN